MKKIELYIVTITYDGDQNAAKPFTSIEDIRKFLEEYAVLTDSNPKEYIEGIPSIAKMKEATGDWCIISIYFRSSLADCIKRATG